MKRCQPRPLTESIKAQVCRFYEDEAGRCPCVVTGTEFAERRPDIAHLDDDRLHSYRHNLVPLHARFNRHFGGLMGNHGSPTRKPVRCEFTQLDWDSLRMQAQLHREQWRFRRAYACVRIGYYTATHYYHSDLAKRYEVMAECLYFARHVWDEEMIWALLDHDLVPLLRESTRTLRRDQVAEIVRQLAAFWTDLRRANAASIIIKEHDNLVDRHRRDAGDRKIQCSLLRRRGLDAVTRDGLAGLRAGASFAKESLSLAATLEEEVNALEVESWLAQDRGKWLHARGLLEEVLIPRVLPLVEGFARDLRRLRHERKLGTVPLKIPPHLTPLNAAQVPIDYAVSIVKTGGRSKSELRKVSGLIETSMTIYDLMGTRPFMLTEDVRTIYKDVGRAIGDNRLEILAGGRVLSPQTLDILKKVSKSAVYRLSEAKT